MAPLRSDSLPMPPTPVPTMPARGNCSPQPYAPLTSLVEALSNSIVLPTMDCYAAEASFGLQMKQIATVHPELCPLLAEFGWVDGRWQAPRVDVHGLRASLQDSLYEPIALIGKGAYGAVHRARNRETNEPLAMKRIKSSSAYGVCESAVREVSLLRDLGKHPNIVHLKDVIAAPTSSSVYLILELLDLDLYTALRQYPSAFTTHRVKVTALQLLAGLRHAHARGVMHRDLKPQNVLLAKANGLVKIADFGMARGFLPEDDKSSYTDWVVTLYYRAPELLLGSKAYGSGVDMWSAGCVLAEMLNGGPLFAADTEMGMLTDMFSKLGTPCHSAVEAMVGTEGAVAAKDMQCHPPQPMGKLVPALANDPAGQDLLSRLLSFDPRKRITASQAMAHPWFAGVEVPEAATTAAAAARPPAHASCAIAAAAAAATAAAATGRA